MRVRAFEAALPVRPFCRDSSHHHPVALLRELPEQHRLPAQRRARRNWETASVRPQRWVPVGRLLTADRDPRRFHVPQVPDTLRVPDVDLRCPGRPRFRSHGSRNHLAHLVVPAFGLGAAPLGGPETDRMGIQRRWPPTSLQRRPLAHPLTHRSRKDPKTKQRPTRPKSTQALHSRSEAISSAYHR